MKLLFESEIKKSLYNSHFHFSLKLEFKFSSSIYVTIDENTQTFSVPVNQSKISCNTRFVD